MPVQDHENERCTLSEHRGGILSERRRPHAECRWIKALEEVGVFLSDPLDLDFSMLAAFPDAYRRSSPGGTGPGNTAAALRNAKKATLKKRGDPTLYADDYDDEFRWYPYLFLNRSKPETHIAALSRIPNDDLASNAPASLKALIDHVENKLGLGDGDDDGDDGDDDDDGDDHE